MAFISSFEKKIRKKENDLRFIMKVNVERFGYDNLLQDFKFMESVVRIAMDVWTSIAILTGMFNVDFHDKFTTFWIILFFYFSSYCWIPFPYLLSYQVLLTEF